jgi:hypothetical protein
MNAKTQLVFILAAGCLWLAPHGLAIGQSRSATTGATVQDAPGSTADQPASEQDAGDEEAVPILKISSVELMRSTHAPELDIVRVRGLSSTENWSDPQLVAISRGPSADGMLDLLFVARAPDDVSTATKFGPMEAIFVIEPGHPYKGIRVRSATNTVKLTQLPGYAEVQGREVDCSGCVGKTYVPKGGAGGGKDAVREEDLPTSTRVLRENDGIRKLDTDPNRLTLILGPNDRIVQAFWD